MQLKYTSSIRKRIICLNVETTNFTTNERIALEELGEPVIEMEKMFKGKYPVQFSKTIRTGLKLAIRFDGRENIEEASQAANEFVEELGELIRTKMSDLMETYDDVNFIFDRKNGLTTL